MGPSEGYLPDKTIIPLNLESPLPLFTSSHLSFISYALFPAPARLPYAYTPAPPNHQAPTHLSYLIDSLRIDHLYCFWCAARYGSVEEMNAPGGCPGEDEDDH